MYSVGKMDFLPPRLQLQMTNPGVELGKRWVVSYCTEGTQCSAARHISGSRVLTGRALDEICLVFVSLARARGRRPMA